MALERLGESSEHSSIRPKRKRSKTVHANQVTQRDLDQVIKDLEEMKRNRRNQYPNQDEDGNPLSLAIQEETILLNLKIPRKRHDRMSTPMIVSLAFRPS